MDDDGELEAWLAADYKTAYRTACLVLRDPNEAQDAVQEAVPARMALPQLDPGR